MASAIDDPKCIISRHVACEANAPRALNASLIIEHNPDIIKTADHVLDLGPEGGNGGGRIVAAGPPREIAQVRGSYTGAMLQEIFATGM